MPGARYLQGLASPYGRFQGSGTTRKGKATAFPAASSTSRMDPPPPCLWIALSPLKSLLQSLSLVPLPPPACQSLLQSAPASQPALLQAWLPSLTLTWRSHPCTPPYLPNLSSWGLPLALVGASSHVPRPFRCLAVTAWPWSQGPPACLH